MSEGSGGRAAKVIAVFSDGAGNSAAKMFKTNVWRLYQALDLGPPRSGEAVQIAVYDDGVGTSNFRPLALLGGAFGVGLKRNVLELYKFLCRNYREGDRIYAFGFSRGAFTIRVLVGFVATQNLVKFESERELDPYALDAYRAYRRRYGGRLRKGSVERIRHVELLRNLRDRIVAWRRRRQGFKTYDQVEKREVPSIDFVGVWDTVAAYGMPIAELTRAIDKWIWPLSMPNYKLSEKVKAARHALALDDERDTFHPLLWDEVRSRNPERIRQVWFAGMHSDVGGGYPDDGLAQFPLAWMMEEAERADLRFRPDAVSEVRRRLSHSAPMHNSRRGFAAYYRYQPRRIDARMAAPEPTALVMRSPNDRGRLTSVKIHESVLERIRSGVEGYAPIVLPERYEIVGKEGGFAPQAEHLAAERYALQQWLWNDVWRRRGNYFLTVGLSLVLALLPLLQLAWPPSACTGPACALAPLIRAAGAVLPRFLECWTEAFAATPHLFLAIVVAIGILMRRAGRLQSRLRDEARQLWERSLRLPGAPAAPSAAARMENVWEKAIHRLWTGLGYQRALREAKWTIGPWLFACLLRGVAVAALAVALLVPFFVVLRAQIAVEERWGTACEGVAPPSSAVAFSVDSACQPIGAVSKGGVYQVAFRLTARWSDGDVSADPRGFENDKLARWTRYAALPFRRSIEDRWLQPMIKIAPASPEDLGWFERLLAAAGLPARGFAHLQALEAARNADCDCTLYVAEFRAARSGQLYLFVNDGVAPAGWRWIARLLTGHDSFYADNSGAAEVRIQRVR